MSSRQPQDALNGAGPVPDSKGTRHIAYFLRHPGNLHYFASLRPYLDRLRRNGNFRHHLVVADGLEQVSEEAEYEGYRAFFTDHHQLDDYDLVLTPTFLRAHERSARTRAVQVFHGMSDKPFTYDRDFSDYLMCLCAGRRQRDRLRANRQNRDVDCALIGFPKFDRLPTVPRLFRNNKSTLIYCPTWRKEGISSIERFLESPETLERLARCYNLIIKPHPNLFNPARKFYDPGIVERLERAAQVPDVRVVRAGNVMGWLEQADLFIGDISSAGYEWLYFDRPMVFLNPRPGVLHPTTDPAGLTYLWQCGPVCDQVEALPDFVRDAFKATAYARVREQVLHYSVHKPRQGGAVARGAAVIERLLSQPVPQPGAMPGAREASRLNGLGEEAV